MYNIVVNIEVNPDKVWEFTEATKKSREETLKEKGCYRYEILHNIDEENKFTLIEEYVNAVAFNEHKETPHFKEWRDFVNPITKRSSSKNIKIS